MSKQIVRYQDQPYTQIRVGGITMIRDAVGTAQWTAPVLAYDPFTGIFETVDTRYVRAEV